MNALIEPRSRSSQLVAGMAAAAAAAAAAVACLLGACDRSERTTDIETAERAGSPVADTTTSTPAAASGQTWKGTAGSRVTEAAAAGSGTGAAPKVDRQERQLAAAEPERERNEFLSVAEMTVALLEDESPEAARLNERAYGHAVFDAGSAGASITDEACAAIERDRSTPISTAMKV